jgi:hypothetical protein
MTGVGTTHHVKLGDRYYLIRPGSYIKREAPTFGARFATGDPDYSQLNFWQHWEQHNWIGGMDAPEWTDKAMYDDGVGLDTTNENYVALARDLTRGTGTWVLNSPSQNCSRQFVVYNDVLYCLMRIPSGSSSYLYSYSATTDAWTLFKTFSSLAQWATSFGGSLYVGGTSTTIDRYTSGVWSTVARPVPAVTDPVTPPYNQIIYTMGVYRDRLYVCFGRFIWRLKSDNTWDGATLFFEAGGVDDFVATETHLGYLYFLSRNGKLFRTDGNGTFDIWGWDGGTRGVSLRSYDGRLFVGTYEFEDTADTGQGVLYQFSGSAVTQLKRWGKVGRATSVGNLIVHDRKLYYGASSLFGMASGFGVAVYDAIEDAHSIFATNRDTGTYADTSGVGRDWMVDDVFFFGGYLFVSVRGHGLFRTALRFRDINLQEATFDLTGNGPDNVPPNGGFLTSSDYDAGTPGLDKLWRLCRITCDLPDIGCTVGVEYSLDGGETYVALPLITKTGTAIRYHATLPLQNIHGTRLKYRLSLRSLSAQSTPKVKGVAFNYLPQPEPNWAWDFSVVITRQNQLLDGSTEQPDTNDEFAYLQTLFRSGDLIAFTDIDGRDWASDGAGVLMLKYQEDLRFLNADVREGEIRLTLLEAVEQYE